MLWQWIRGKEKTGRLARICSVCYFTCGKGDKGVREKLCSDVEANRKVPRGRGFAERLGILWCAPLTWSWCCVCPVWCVLPSPLVLFSQCFQVTNPNSNSTKPFLCIVELLCESPRLLSSCTADKLVSDQLLVFSRNKLCKTYFCTVRTDVLSNCSAVLTKVCDILFHFE